MIIVIGEILFDVFPDGRRLGGAPFNFAHHLKRFGFPVRFISRVGDDEPGREILSRVAEAGFDPDDIQQDPARPTGWVKVDLDDQGVPEFDIIADVAYDYLEITTPLLETVRDGTDMIYFGTLIQRTETGASAVMSLLENRDPACRCFYDMNLRPDCWDENAIVKSLIHSDILKISEEELDIIRRQFGSPADEDLFIDDLKHNFSILWVSLTRGSRGSRLFTPEGAFSAPVEPVGDAAADTVGAGDAYAAVLAAGCLKEWDPPETIDRAARFARAVCGIQGAVPESADFYAPFKPWMISGR